MARAGLDPLTPERRRRQTRDYLLQAAAEVFAERGFHGASLDDVAARAGFSKGAVYWHFKSKEDLFLALLEHRTQQEMDPLRATIDASGSDTDTRVTELASLVWSNFDETWGALSQEFRTYALHNEEARAKLVSFERGIIASVAEIIEAQRSRHGIDSSESALHQARIVEALTRGLMDMRMFDPEAVGEDVLQTAMAFVSRAMTSAPATSGTGKARPRRPKASSH